MRSDDWILVVLAVLLFFGLYPAARRGEGKS